MTFSGRLPEAGGRRRRVLVTGATGYIASQLLPVFRQRYDLVLLDVRTTDAAGQPVVGVEIADFLATEVAGLARFFDGVDAAVHLGYWRPPGKKSDPTWIWRSGFSGWPWITAYVAWW
jgi:nucleoside-diphosphate-sugar epimerase